MPPQSNPHTPADTTPHPGPAGHDPDPAIHALTDQVIALEAALNAADAWDIKPQIFLWQPPTMTGLIIPHKVWQRADNHPSFVLELLTGQWAQIRMDLIQHDPALFSQPPQAVVLCHEGWGLDMAAVAHDPLKTAEYQRVAAARRIAVHPDRIDMRTVMAVHITGRVVSANRTRGRAQALVCVNDPGHGLVPDSLRQFLTFITALDQP